MQKRRRACIAGWLPLVCWVGLATFVVSAAEDEAAQKRVYEQPITVRGTVSDNDGAPVAEAKVYLLCTTYPVSRRLAVATTDDEGYYEFRDVGLSFARPEQNVSAQDSGSFELLAVASGHGFGWRPRKACFLKASRVSRAHEIDPPGIVFADEPIELDLQLTQSTSLTGTILDEEGKPIAGVDLQLRYCARINEEQIARNVVGSSNIYELSAMNQRFDVPAEVKVRQTDEEGGFEFTDLPPYCLFRIDLRHPGYANSDVWMATTEEAVPKLGGKTTIHSTTCELTFRRVYPVQIRIVYEDTNEPAPGVLVTASHQRTTGWETTDENGLVTLRLPTDDYNVHLLPAKGTPYLITNSTDENPLTVTNPPQEQPAVYRLQRGCNLEVSIVDAETGKGIPNVDLWINQRGQDLMVRSWKPPVSYVDRPESDEHGKMTALVKPGKQRIGAGNSKRPAGYQLDNAGQEIDCAAGETVPVTFRLQRDPQQ